MAENSEERKVRILLDAQQATASVKEMGAAAAIMNSQLVKMSQDDPRRAQLINDHALLRDRIRETTLAQRTYVKSAEELAAEQDQLIKQNREVMLNGQHVTASFKEMKSAAALLERQLHELSGDDPGRAKMLADYQALERRIDGVNKELKGAGESSGFFKQSMASALGVITGGGVLELAGQAFSFLKDAKTDAESAAQAGAQLEATIKSTGMAAGVTQQQIEELATARMGLTLFDDDDTKASASLLLTFTNIKNGVFQEAMPAIQDLAQKMAGDGPADLKGASIQVGKALNDPIKGITALSRVGVSFSEEQKKVIEQLVATGDTAGAQRIILGELNKEFGGSAEAARKAAGPLGTLKMQFADTKETIGGFVVDGLSKATDWLGRLWDKTQPVRDIFADLWQEGTRLYNNLYDVAESLGLVSDKGDSVGFVAKLLIGLFSILTAGVRLTVGTINALVDGFISLYNKSEVFRGVVGGLVETFKGVAKAAWDTLGGVGDLLVGIFTLDTAKIKSGLKQTFDSVSDLTYKAGYHAADNFYKGYVGAKDNRIVRKAQAQAGSANGGTAADPATNGEEGGDDSLAEAAAAKRAKKEESAERQRQARQRKKDQQRLNDLKEWVAQEGGLLEMRSALHARLDGQALSDEMQRRQLQREKIFEEATKKVNQLSGQELDYTERLKAIVAERDLQLRELAGKFAEEDLKEKQVALDQKLADEAAATAERVAQLELNLANGVIDEQAFQDAVYLVKQSAALRELAFLKEKYGAESAEAKKKNAEILKGEADHVTKVRAEQDGLLKFEKGLAAAKKIIGTDEVNMLGDFFGKKSLIYKAAVAAQKAIALTEIGIGLQKQIAANSEAGAKISASAPPVTVPLGVAYTIGTNALAVIGAAGATAKVAGFREGGRTLSRNGSNLLDLSQLSIGLSGKLLDQEGFAVAGLVHENEYVIPEWMRQDPKVIQVEQWLEQKRQRGGGSFRDGGPTTEGDGHTPTGAGLLGESSEMTALLRTLVEGLRRQDERMDTWARELTVVQQLYEFDQAYDTYKKVNQENAVTD
ncbi:hypothetical protein [Hymenobacter sp. BT190]|uniref:hypothetical protein n=1 Tax=Hymenobacter sp. BT190 TaxID=2763505 RepID=UPI0016518F21|nr:hypothetical protein [Hymenobacter sp. BT190]MBC6698864.1 hypothetical protein [Hymenobacter sp. BT190]